MIGMKNKLNDRLSYLNGTVKRRVINDVLQAMMVPSPSMIEAGARSMGKDMDKPRHIRAEWTFQAMIAEAQEGG